MVYAEKIVTAIARGTTSTRWRDLADIYLLARHHPVDGNELSTSIHEVARHRGTTLAPLAQALAGYGAIGQQRWDAWRRKQLLDDRLPATFANVIDSVVTFADPAITGTTSAAAHQADKSVAAGGRPEHRRTECCPAAATTPPRPPRLGPSPAAPTTPNPRPAPPARSATTPDPATTAPAPAAPPAAATAATAATAAQELA